MKFKLIKSTSEITCTDLVYLIYEKYDDFGYCTTFHAYTKLSLEKNFSYLGYLKIGAKNLKDRVEKDLSQNGFDSYSVESLIPSREFECLPDDLFSLGQNIEYYKKINLLFQEKNEEYYSAINDIAFNFKKFKELYQSREPSFINSLMRDLHKTNVEQFHRISIGEAELTKYNFSFEFENQKINIDVTPKSLPPTNIHVLIGRNGVGKTWLIYNMICKLLKSMDINLDENNSEKYKLNDKLELVDYGNGFAGIIGISFSVFDDGLSSINIPELNNESKDNRTQEESININNFEKSYKYIGLVSKKQKNGIVKIKPVDHLTKEFISSLKNITKDKNKLSLYLEICENLNTDLMFYENGFVNRLKNLPNFNDNDYYQIEIFFKKLSSGHMIIILSLTKLCESIFEKTIVFIDEPETHLHPPLLSTYIRSLSLLLRKKNAVGIIATHSPVVLQEVPKSCVTRVDRNYLTMTFSKPSLETFASSTDSLIREIFGYEMIKTGFYKLLEEETCISYEKTIEKFHNQVGFLGQIMIQGLLNKQGESNDEKN